MTGEPPAPPESFGFDDAERELYRRVMALPWIEPIDSMVVSMLVSQASLTRQVVDEIGDAKATGEHFTFDPDEAIADELRHLHECLAACEIDLPLARQLGLLPLGIVGDEAAAPRRSRTLRRLGKRQTAELIASWREEAARYRARRRRWLDLAEQDPSHAEMFREMAESAKQAADEYEKGAELL